MYCGGDKSRVPYLSQSGRGAEAEQHGALPENTWELRENKQTRRREEEDEGEERQDEEGIKHTDVAGICTLQEEVMV